MDKLVERIKTHGNVLGEGVLKVDQFLTHQVDYELMREIGTVFAERFQESGITKVVTIEASSIVRLFAFRAKIIGTCNFSAV